MTHSAPPGAAAEVQPPAPGAGSSSPAWRRTRDLATLVVGFAVAGLPAGVVWSALVHPARYIVPRQGRPFLDEPALGQVFSSDGTFAVVMVVLGLLAGGVAAGLYHRHGVWTVLGVLVGGAVASWVTYRVGQWLGPDDLRQALRSAGPGDRVPIPLHVRSGGLFLAAPIGSLVGLMVVTGFARGSDSTRM